MPSLFFCDPFLGFQAVSVVYNLRIFLHSFFVSSKSDQATESDSLLQGSRSLFNSFFNFLACHSIISNSPCLVFKIVVFVFVGILMAHQESSFLKIAPASKTKKPDKHSQVKNMSPSMVAGFLSRLYSFSV